VHRIMGDFQKEDFRCPSSIRRLSIHEGFGGAEEISCSHCGCRGEWTLASFIEETVAKIRATVGKVI
jgi:hypothetical protein